MTYISWSSDFALYLEHYLMDEGHTLDYRSVWHKHWPHKIPVGQWPIFCGPVILLNILKTVWWRNIILIQWISVTQRLASLNICWSVTVTYISCTSDFAVYLENYMMDESHIWYNGSVWHKDWPHKIYIDQWPITCVSDFILYFEGYLMGEHHIWGVLTKYWLTA